MVHWALYPAPSDRSNVWLTRRYHSKNKLNLMILMPKYFWYDITTYVQYIYIWYKGKLLSKNCVVSAKTAVVLVW